MTISMTSEAEVMKLVLMIDRATGASETVAEGVIVASETEMVVLAADEDGDAESGVEVATWTWFCFRMMLSTEPVVAAAE